MKRSSSKVGGARGYSQSNNSPLLPSLLKSATFLFLRSATRVTDIKFPDISFFRRKTALANLPGARNLLPSSPLSLFSLTLGPRRHRQKKRAMSLATTSLSTFAQALTSSLAEARLVPGSAEALIPREFIPTTRLGVSFDGWDVELGNLFRVREVKLAPFVSFEAEVSLCVWYDLKNTIGVFYFISESVYIAQRSAGQKGQSSDSLSCIL